MKKYKIILTIISSITILILSGCLNGPTTPNIPNQGGDINHKPIISDLSASPRTAFIDQNITITCTASDQDGDTLAYSWSSSPGGTINEIGSNITWEAPATKGTHSITCLVSDGKGGEDSKSLDITVASDSGGVRYSISWSKAKSNGWKNPLGEGKELITSTAYDYDSGIYLYNHPGKKHMGIDIVSEKNDKVYAIADGTIRKIERGSDPKKMVVIIEHKNSNNKDFFAIYGHVLARSDLEVNSKVKAGKNIGVVNKSGSPCHLHFGVNLASEFIDDKYDWGRIPESDNPSKYDWVDPIDYLNTHSVGNIVSGSITVIPSTMSLVEGDSQTISSITAHYSDGSTAGIAFDDCTYDSSNTGVATVDTGVITAVAAGTANISVSYMEGAISKTDTVEVTVNSVTPVTYTITASAGSHGSISPSGDVTVNEGTDQPFTITPDSGYQIDDVLVDGSSIGAENSYTFTNVTEDHSISTTFISVAPGLVHNINKGTYYNTIQAALDDADNDNTIEVSDGTYDENISFPYGENLTLQSANGASSTIIRGDDGLPTVSFYNTNGFGSYTIKGFTITHASGNYGTGIYAKGNLTIKNCTIISNNYDYFGAGITNYSGSITITGSTISGNSAGNYHGGGIHNYSGSITITGSTISGNSAGIGGGIENYWGSITIITSTISGNSANGDGGGIYNYGRIDSLTITGSTISGNSSGGTYGSGDGGGIGGMLQTAIIGGMSEAEKNIICGNYKSGEDPSLDQQITDGDSGSLYEIYKDTNYISAYCD